MALESDLTLIENELKKCGTKAKRLEFLNNQIYEWEKALIEFNSYDLPNLERLKEKTRFEYEVYREMMDEGHLVYIDKNGNNPFWENRLKSAKNYSEKELKMQKKLFNEWSILEGRRAFLLSDLRHYENLKMRVMNEVEQPPKKDEKEEIWFKVGLLFAKGEIETEFEKNGQNATATAKHFFGEKYRSYRPYISESINSKKSEISDKNIFSKPDKLLKIYTHCKENNIQMTKEFEARIPLD